MTFWCAFDISGKKEKIKKLELETADPTFWGQHHKAQQKMKALSDLREETQVWQDIQSKAETLKELLALAIEEEDDSLTEGVSAEVIELQDELKALEFNLVLSGPYDDRTAIVALHAGAGGVDSQDWAQMLMRMYLRWSERRGFKTDVMDTSVGDEAGIKSATMQITGRYAYGYLKAERGVHRLVRLSPFDSDHARHTSFALIEVLPEAEEGVDVTIDHTDIKTEAFRAGGAGGQSVQKNSTAIRLTHIPTGIKVSCQNERSQYQNKEIAMKILLARLIEYELRIRAKKLAEIKGDHISPAWGNQIRSYILHPYKMVKDHRTEYDSSNPESVLDGEIDGFMNAYLTHTMGDK